jgi:hypothetical protein
MFGLHFQSDEMGRKQDFGEALIKPVLYQGTTLAVPQVPQNQGGF